MSDRALLGVWIIVGGVLMVVMGILAVVGTSVVGPMQGALLRMNAMHGEVHALGGVLALGTGLFVRGRAQAMAILGYGALFVLGFVLNIASPDFFGMMPDAPANLGVHVMHATVALVSLLAGYRLLPSTVRAR